MAEVSAKQKIGLGILTALVAGNMIGSGVFTLPAVLAETGSISLLSFAFSAVGALLLGLVFAKLSTVMPRIGGPYAYCRAAFGDFIGFQMAYNYWIALWVGNAAITVALTGYLSFFFPVLSTSPGKACLTSISVVWLMTMINLMGVKQAGFMQLASTILKLIPLLLISMVGIFFIHPSNFSAFNLTGHSHVWAFTGAATQTLWAFIGLESASIPANNIIDPRRNIPRATILGIAIAATVYMLSSIAVMGTIPMATLAHSSAPYAEAARIMFGPVGSIVVAVGAIIACAGALNGWILLQGQIPLAAANDHLFPSFFSKISRNGTPSVGLVVSSVLITILLLLTLGHSLVNQFKTITLIATLASLIPYFFTTMAELVIFTKYPGTAQGSKRGLVISIGIAILAGIYSFWAIIGSGKEVVFYGMLLFFSSIPLYALMNWRKQTMGIGLEKETPLL